MGNRSGCDSSDEGSDDEGLGKHIDSRYVDWFGLKSVVKLEVDYVSVDAKERAVTL